LSAAERARLAPIIRARALAVGVGAASVREIDRLNIYHASTLAMRRALARLSVSPDHVLIDGSRSAR
jgi:ribonuclease HII